MLVPGKIHSLTKRLIAVATEASRSPLLSLLHLSAVRLPAQSHRTSSKYSFFPYRNSTWIEAPTYVCCPRGVDWWNPTPSVFCELLNHSKKPAVIPQEGQLIAHIVAIQTHASERFKRFFSMGTLTSDRPSLCPPQTPLPSTGLDDDLPDPDNIMQSSHHASCGKLDVQPEEKLMVILD